MPCFSFDGKRPIIGRECFVAESAELIGDIRMGDRCYIGFGAVIRADYGRIVIGDETSIEEGCICHAKPGETLSIGQRVTLGHGAIIHGAEIHREVVIGMGAVVGFDAIIGEGAVVAEGSVVPAGSAVPSGYMVGGVPAKVLKRIDSGQRAFIDKVKRVYVNLARTYDKRLRQIGVEP